MMAAAQSPTGTAPVQQQPPNSQSAVLVDDPEAWRST